MTFQEKTRLKKCVSPALIDWNEPVEPKYKLDSTKFLIPALIWGPMNQGMTSNTKLKWPPPVKRKSYGV